MLLDCLCKPSDLVQSSGSNTTNGGPAHFYNVQSQSERSSIAGIYRTDKREESLKHKEKRHSDINTSLRAIGIMDDEILR